MRRNETENCPSCASTTESEGVSNTCSEIFTTKSDSLTEENEFKTLALQLQSVCGESGIELYPEASAEIIHKMGLILFKQRSDKLSLIKSVGLLNAAMVRGPLNCAEIKKDLSLFCSHILKQANAQNQTVDLLQQANHVKIQVASMRKEAEQQILSMQNTQTSKRASNPDLKHQQKCKIESIKRIQSKITSNYKDIMIELCQYCEEVMGPPPCKFAVVAMGSLSRKEVTPYSDFEHIILLEIQEHYECNLEYFRWFSVIFHVIILNLQETIIPSLNIMYLNDKDSELGDWFFDTHTNGVSFDGMMPHACKFPLGRTQPTKKKPWTTELIKPVDEMLQYLSSDISLKNGYHLSDILTETCFVYGDQTLHKTFQKGIQNYNQESKSQCEILEDMRQQVNEDLDKFSTRFKLANLKSEDKLNVKQMFYRTSTLFIAALGKLRSSKSSSCFDIIDDLAKQKMISDQAKHKLSFAVAIACEVRLKIYMKEKSHHDYIQRKENSANIFDEFLSIVDIDSIVSYFQITYSLQREVIQLLRIKESHIYSSFTLLNITICYALRLDNLMLTLIEKFVKTEDPGLYKANSDFLEDNIGAAQKQVPDDQNTRTCFDICIFALENELCNVSDPSSKPWSQTQLRKILENLTAVAELLYRNDSIGEAMEFLERVLEILQRLSLNDEEREKISREKDFNMGSLITLVKSLMAGILTTLSLNHFPPAHLPTDQTIESIESKDKISCNPKEHSSLYFVPGNIYLKKNQFEKSLNFLQISLSIALSVDFKGYKMYQVMIVYSGIGTCLFQLKRYDESLVYLKIAAQLIEDHKIDADKDVLGFVCNRATTYHNLGKCLMKLQQFEEAFPYLYLALDIATEGNLNEDSDFNLTELANKSVASKRNIQDLSFILFDIGQWYMQQNRFQEALSNLQRSYNILNKLSESEEMAKVRLSLLTCYMEIYQHERIKSNLSQLHDSGKAVALIVKDFSRILTYSIQI